MRLIPLGGLLLLLAVPIIVFASQGSSETPGDTSTDARSHGAAVPAAPEQPSRTQESAPATDVIATASAGDSSALSIAAETAEPAQAEISASRTVTLVQGFNLVTWLGPATSVEEATRPIAGAFDALFGWDPARQALTTWRRQLPAGLRDLTMLNTEDAFWINVTAPAGVAWEQPLLAETSPARRLVPGWNLIAWTGADGVTPRKIFAPLGNVFAAAFAFAPETDDFRVFGTDRPAQLNTLATVNSGDALWLLMNAATTLAFTTPEPPSGDPPPAGDPGAVVVRVGDAVAGELTEDFERDDFLLTLEAGDAVVIETDDLDGDFDTLLRLFDLDGVSLLRVDDDGGVGVASRIDWVASADGAYLIAVESSGGIGEGTYTLRVTASDRLMNADDHGNVAATASDLDEDMTIDGVIDPASDVDWVRWPAVGGQTYQINTFDLGLNLLDLTAGLSVDLVLTVFDTDGRTILAVDNSSGKAGIPAEIEWTAPASGTYLVRVASYLGQSSGSYSLTVDQVPGG